MLNVLCVLNIKKKFKLCLLNSTVDNIVQIIYIFILNTGKISTKIKFKIPIDLKNS